MTTPIAHHIQNDRIENLVADVFQAVTIALVTGVGLLTVALTF